ncbi:uncharacterized protein LOC118481884 isoform X4 [Helianthus annuus]|uniref:uncharacterized protein LOC118481884 isoform X4 n=1 Tax=Helianthus annuus TaxID=4232 RepID=UPI001652D041|nr:uncharacterized protein LOC118481884 isoform X4 [Helianthus annuus]
MGRRTESWLAQQWSSPTFTTSPNHSCYISEFLVSVYSVYFHSFHIIFATYLDPKDLIRADAVLVEEADLIQSSEASLASVLELMEFWQGAWF